MTIILQIGNEIRKCENKYPMTGKLDKKASYKNGWYDCAFHLRGKLVNFLKGVSNGQ